MMTKADTVLFEASFENIMEVSATVGKLVHVNDNQSNTIQGRSTFNPFILIGQYRKYIYILKQSRPRSEGSYM